ncbi:protachykinin-1-like [Nerophis ophidion]|uniref:protachykinin-1-like n=1 Tax=Nerophis ophidion TaxID=159077 RepID=UPI002ADF2B54|nr:protachykinin-1-like [Nerophis ophidion]
MEALRLAAVLLLLVLAGSLGTLGGPLSGQEDDMEAWSMDDWQGSPSETQLTLRLVDLLKRSKAQQFHGLMGRSLGTSHPMNMDRKRNKGEMFVGLMGRRSLDEDVQEGWNSY